MRTAAAEDLLSDALRLANPLRRYLLSKVPDRHAAPDLMQEVYLRTYAAKA
jgi:DNA-directed RNA polymerase specialized sigma24 family protein